MSKVIGSCKLKDTCVAPISCYKHGGTDFESCDNFIKSNVSTGAIPKKVKDNKPNTAWNGDWLRPLDLNSIAIRNAPVLISVVGKADAGKTCFLGMLYTLLLHGKAFTNYEFAGSKTLIGWDELHFDLVIKKGKVKFPDPTPLGVNRLYHLAVKDKMGRLMDLLFSDASGETFGYWSQNVYDENGTHAKWVHENSDGFVLFVDCEALIQRKSSAKNEILDIAQQLSANLKNRPIVVVWSKSDRIDKVNASIVSSIKERLSTLFPIYTEINISNLLGATPDDFVHHNNIQAIDWLLDKILTRERVLFTISDQVASSDPFLTYGK